MLGATRLGDFVRKTCDDKSSGPFVTASKDTFVNGRGQVRLHDRSIPGRAVSGSKTCFVNGRPAVRQKDKVICGKITKSSRDTFIGD